MTGAEYKAKCAIAFQAARLALEVAERDPEAAAAIAEGAAIAVDLGQSSPVPKGSDVAESLLAIARALRALPAAVDYLDHRDAWTDKRVKVMPK